MCLKKDMMSTKELDQSLSIYFFFKANAFQHSLYKYIYIYIVCVCVCVESYSICLGHYTIFL